MQSNSPMDPLIQEIKAYRTKFNLKDMGGRKKKRTIKKARKSRRKTRRSTRSWL